MSEMSAKHPEMPSAAIPIVEFFIAPFAEMNDPRDQQRARIAASITIVISILATLGFLVSGINSGSWREATRGFGLVLTISYTAYFLSRSRYVDTGTFIFVLGFCATPFFLLRTGEAANVGQTLLIFLPMGLIAGSFILKARSFLITLFIISVAFLFLPLAGIGLTAYDWAAFGSILAIGFSLFILGALRTRTEKRDLDDLSRANSELDGLRHALELKVTERTETLNRRTAQLEAASYVSRQTASIMDPSVLLDEAVRLVSDRFDFYHAGIFLLDSHGRYAVLQAASSDGGKRMVDRGHRLEVGREGIVGYAAYQKRARIALDVGKEAVYFRNPDLPHTRSEMALPLMVRGKVIGVLDIQSTEPSAFSEEDVSALQSLADQIALALDNGRLLAESQAALKELQAVTSENSYRAWRERLKGRPTAFRFSPIGIQGGGTDKSTRELLNNTEPNTLAHPISLRGREIGKVLAKRQGRGWTAHEETLMADIAAQIALALENARLVEDLQRRSSRDQVIAQAAARFSQTTDLDALLKLALREFHRLPSVEEVSVSISPALNEPLSLNKEV